MIGDRAGPRPAGVPLGGPGGSRDSGGPLRVATVITRLEGGAGVLALRGVEAVEPEAARPTIVTDMNSGSSGATSLTAAIAALALRVSKIVSMSRKSAPPSRKPRAATA